MRLIGIIFALVLAVTAGYAYFSISQPEAPAPSVQISPTVTSAPAAPAIQTADVLVAARSVPIGVALTADMISRQPWPSHLVLSGFVTAGSNATDIVGMVTRSSFQEGEPIILSKLSNPSDPNFLAAALEPGFKVSTIQVDNISAVAGFIFPGDYVDVLVTHDLPVGTAATQQVGAEKKESFTELLLTNIKVLAVDDRSTAGQLQADGAQKRPPSSVSLEVTLEQAQKLRLAQETGYVSLALRSLKDKDVAEETAPTSVGDLTHTSDDQKNGFGADNQPVRVVRGTSTKDISQMPLMGAAQAGSGSVATPK